VLDESDETGNRYVQASMSLVVGEDKVTTTRARLRPGGCADQGDAAGAGEVVPGRGAVAAGHIQCDRDRRGGARHAAHVRVTVSFHAEGHPSWTTAGVSSDLNRRR